MSESTTRSEITIEPRENGPLIVRGLKSMIGPDGTRMETKENIALCRCGGSANKPFCDGSHKTNGYSGARETTKPLHKSREYEGERISVLDNRTICAHAGHCVHDLGSVFRSDASPWIDPDGAEPDAIVGLIRRCPSGALAYKVDGKVHDDFNGEEMIRIDEGGPYHITGGLQLMVEDELAPPSPEHYALCRCGKSQNKPYCDGSHGNLEAGWDAMPAEHE